VVTGVDFTGTMIPLTSLISGTVSGDIQEGVIITLSGDNSDTTTSDSNGDYSFGGITDGNYTITPTLSGYTFSPTSQNVTVSGADESGIDFDATENTYTISGTVTGDVQSGVTITLSGDDSDTTTTDLNGDYFFGGITNGNYTILPSLSDYTFSPTSENVTVSDADETGVDFTSTEVIYTYTLGGTVYGDIQSGVTMTLSGDNSGSTTTDLNGDYSFAGLVNGSYTVTPSLSDYTFSPTSEIVTVSDSAETGVDFTATGQGTDTSIEMVSISGGTFQMGCAPGEMECFSDELPCHSVTLSSFEIGKYEVTQGQWEEVMGNNPSNFYPCGDNCPVERVSWNDTQTFITELNSQTGQSYRLCTEAEWEYAARAGTETKWYCGNDESCVDDIAWYDSNSGSKTHPVGQKSPNAWGLYDMSGNVWEWVEDWYDTYSSGSVTNPTGPVSSSSRVDRGGSWLGSARYCRSTIRYNYYPSRVIYNLGFRLCSGVNFETYTISGTVSGDIQSGVTMTLSGDNSGSTTTDSDGDYSFAGLVNCSYTVTPSLSDYTFSPTSEIVTVSDSAETGVDFTATEIIYTYAISGTVSGDIQSGVTITLSGDNSGSTTTDSDGDYSFAGLVNGSYTVTPSLSDYTFSPTSEIVTVSDSAETGVDFTATGQGTDTSIEMVSISGGTFQMGCAPGEMECFSDELPCHSVTLSSFEIGKYEVTQGQWEEVMGNNPSNFYPCGDNCPVERVSWNDTQTFITELNSQTGQSYRLCTEAEWEYAARNRNKVVLRK